MTDWLANPPLYEVDDTMFINFLNGRGDEFIGPTLDAKWNVMINGYVRNSTSFYDSYYLTSVVIPNNV